MIYQIFVLASVTAVCFGVETIVNKRVIITKGLHGAVIHTYKTNSLTNNVAATLASVNEILTDGSAAGNYSGTVHAFTDLQNTIFTEGPLTADAGNYPDTIIPTSKLSLMTNLDVDTANNLTAMVKLELTVFKTKGQIQMDGATVFLHAGDVKVDVTVENWAFCGAGDVVCDNGTVNVTGAYLDVAFYVTGMENATLKTGSSKTYMLGARSSYTVSNMVVYDGAATSTAMPATYPMQSGNTFTSRLVASAYNTSAMYGSVISLGRDDVFFDATVFNVLGRSGKMTLAKKDNPSEKITFEFDNLKEKLADGSEINEKGHKFNNFASQDFTITDVGMKTYQGLKVKQTTFSAQLTDNTANLTVHTYLFLEDGEVTNHNETYTLRAGAMKFNIEIENWQFCGSQGVNCKQGQTDLVGEFLDFEIVIKGKGDQAQAKNNTDTSKGQMYDMGYGQLTLSTQIEADGNASVMADGYPRLTTQGSKKIFQFRFPKFTQKLLYDPNAELNSDGVESTTARDSTTDGRTTTGGSPNGANARLSDVTGGLLLALIVAVHRLLF